MPALAKHYVHACERISKLLHAIATYVELVLGSAHIITTSLAH
jgi:hypothetical protein